MAQAKSLTQAEITTILTHIDANTNAKRNRMMFLLTLQAGLRVGEVAQLKLADVRNTDGSIKTEVYFAAERVKHAHARTVFLNQRLQAELAEYVSSRTWLDNSQPLFTTLRGAKKPFSANTLAQLFHYLYKKALVFQGSSHSGRRTFITTLAQKGISVRVLASLAGHRSLNTTMRYIDVNDEMKRNAVELV
jgi:integrase/recombinase XerD